MRSFLLAIVVLVGCGATELDPPTIQADRTPCDKCRMLISEPQYAAAYFDNEGTDGYHIFDDIGCMVRKLKAAKAIRVWVHDLPSSAWIVADSATFVYSSHITTPMNYGYVAFRDPATAASYAKFHDGRLVAKFADVALAMEDLAK